MIWNFGQQTECSVVCCKLTRDIWIMIIECCCVVHSAESRGILSCSQGVRFRSNFRRSFPKFSKRRPENITTNYCFLQLRAKDENSYRGKERWRKSAKITKCIILIVKWIFAKPNGPACSRYNMFCNLFRPKLLSIIRGSIISTFPEQISVIYHHCRGVYIIHICDRFPLLV